MTRILFALLVGVALARGATIRHDDDSDERSYDIPDIEQLGPSHTVSSSLEDARAPLHRFKRFTAFGKAAYPAGSWKGRELETAPEPEQPDADDSVEAILKSFLELFGESPEQESASPELTNEIPTHSPSELTELDAQVGLDEVNERTEKVDSDYQSFYRRLASATKAEDTVEAEVVRNMDQDDEVPVNASSEEERDGRFDHEWIGKPIDEADAETIEQHKTESTVLAAAFAKIDEGKESPLLDAEEARDVNSFGFPDRFTSLHVYTDASSDFNNWFTANQEQREQKEANAKIIEQHNSEMAAIAGLYDDKDVSSSVNGDEEARDGNVRSEDSSDNWFASYLEQRNQIEKALFGHAIVAKNYVSERKNTVSVDRESFEVNENQKTTLSDIGTGRGYMAAFPSEYWGVYQQRSPVFSYSPIYRPFPAFSPYQQHLGPHMALSQNVMAMPFPLAKREPTDFTIVVGDVKIQVSSDNSARSRNPYTFSD